MINADGKTAPWRFQDIFPFPPARFPFGHDRTPAIPSNSFSPNCDRFFLPTLPMLTIREDSALYLIQKCLLLLIVSVVFQRINIIFHLIPIVPF